MSRAPVSVRRRVTVVLATGLAVLVVAAGLALDRAVSDRVTEEFDEALVARARAFVALTEQEKGKIELDYTKETHPEFERAERPDYFQFWLDDGRSLLRSRHLDRELPRAEGLRPGPEVTDVLLPDGRAGRLVQLAFVPRHGVPGGDPAPASEAPPPSPLERPPGVRAVVLAVATGRDRLDPLLSSLRWAIVAIGGVAAAVAAFFVWRAVTAGFRPLDAVASQVSRLDADRLDARVAVAGAPSEVAGVVETLNALLARLEASFERERRFTGNVAHELRTPIAELRSLATVAARWPGDEAAVARYFGDVKDVAGRMERLIADLLLLARCEAGAEVAAREPTNLRALVDAAWAPLAPLAAEAGLVLRCEVPDDLVVESDPGKLAVVVANLLGNAVHHAQAGGEIRCEVKRAGGAFELVVENPAEPLSAEDLTRLGEPFWRKDRARSSAEHAGLGLALVTALARLLGVEARFEQDPDGTLRARLGGRAAGAGRPASKALTPA